MDKFDPGRELLKRSGIVMGTPFLVIIFYLIFTPVGLFMKLFRIDLLERRKKEETYWKNKKR